MLFEICYMIFIMKYLKNIYFISIHVIEINLIVMHDVLNLNASIKYGRGIRGCLILQWNSSKLKYESTILFWLPPNLPCHFSVPVFTAFSLFFLLERWYEAWSRNSNHTVKAFPLNYLVMVSIKRHKVYLWTLLKAWYLAAVFRVYLYSGSYCCGAWYFSLSFRMTMPSCTGRAYLDVCHPGNGGSVVCLSTLFHTPIKIHSKWNLGVTMTLNAMTLFPITLSCPIVQNSPKRPYSKSRRNQMREKSITFLSPLSLPWLNYWNKMLHLEESLERLREREREGEREVG